ncbi:MAG: hypothetical protein HZC36_09140 [Armatimonadetes bacterium]|nr:hypothetical protein [Armatimonadota bacterium]
MNEQPTALEQTDAANEHYRRATRRAVRIGAALGVLSRLAMALGGVVFTLPL